MYFYNFGYNLNVYVINKIKIRNTKSVQTFTIYYLWLLVRSGIWFRVPVTCSKYIQEVLYNQFVSLQTIYQLCVKILHCIMKIIPLKHLKE